MLDLAIEAGTIGTMQQKILMRLLEATWKSPVFGNSFHAEASLKSEAVTRMIEALTKGFSTELYAYIRPACSASDAETRAIVDQIAPKTVSFCPALTAGELDDMPRLQAVAVAIGLMYWADQTMDRGDEAMPYAIGMFGQARPTIPAKLRQKAKAQATALQGIINKVQFFARPEDAAFVLDCFDRQVLLNEVSLDQLSTAYQKATNKAAFLEVHAAKIAHYMIEDAGFPSVSSSLYAIYRQHDPDLPPLREIYNRPELANLLQLCNAVVRVADELGDWETDAGNHPEWGKFCVNLFNQACPALLRTFFAKAYIPSAMQAELEELFMLFRDNAKTRPVHGEQIMEIFFGHVAKCITDLPPTMQQRYACYITLCKRVLEIGYVNRIGDIALAENDKSRINSLVI